MDEKKYRGGAHAAGKRVSPKKEKPQKAAEPGEPKPKRKGLGALCAAGILLALVIGFCGFTAYQLYFNDTIRKGVFLGEADLSGKTVQEARAALEELYGGGLDRQLTITAGGQTFTLTASDAGLSYDIAGSARAAYEYGRQGGLLQRAKDLWSARTGKVQLELATTLDEQVLKTQAELISAQVQQPLSPSSYSYADGVFTVDKGQAGYVLDGEDLCAQMENALRTAQFDAPIEGKLKITQPQPLDADTILAQINQEPVETTLDLQTDPTGNTVVAGRDGVTLDRSELEKALSSDQRIVTVTCQVTHPKYTATELKALLFRDVLGECTSSFNARLKGRTTNVLLANGFCNGVILLPGQVFSYNETVGPRTYERGFQDAIVYVGSSAEDGVGGGICQVSSTLYAAMLRADLKTVERYPHSREVTYVGKGEDATVAWGSKDFRFENNTDYPIKLVTSNTENTITIKILGTQTQPNKTVKIETKILEKIPFEVQRVLDETLTPGTEKVESNGYTGYKSETYRVVYVNGVQISRELENRSTYKKYDKVVHYNPAPGQPAPDPTPAPAPTPTPEPTPDPAPDPAPPEDTGNTGDPFPWLFD